MTLFAQYIKEREGKNIVEDQYGFATYIFQDQYCYIEDIYVVPEQRKSGHASRYADAITEIARAKGYKKLLGSVSPSAHGSTQSLKVLLSYGFKLEASQNNAIYLVKEI